MASTLILGANRGIGLALARCHAGRDSPLIATCRRPSEALAALPLQVIDDVDMTDDISLRRLDQRLGEHRLARLIVNAGILRRDALDTLAGDGFADLAEQLLTNALAPLRVVRTLLHRLDAGSKVALLTSRMGSIADNGSGGYYGYRMSKAALNAAGRSLALDLAPRGIAVVLLHPGFVRTEMTGGQGDISAEQAAAQLTARIDELDASRSGRFLHANGQELPW
jgi:NAD(P)-dependent dehydrogenase (short-subunit alcohol dehydrogenase family)